MGKIYNLYKYLLQKHGKQNWWPCKGEKYGNDEIAIGAILTQNTSWKNVEKALENLRHTEALNLKAIAEMKEERLKELIKPAGFYNQKAERLKLFAKHITENYKTLKHFFESKPLKEQREELLKIKGIGKETADSILLYAGFKPVFVVDKYTFRIFNHYGIINMNKFDYEKIRTMVEREIKKVEDMQEFHALIVQEGKILRKNQNSK